MLTQYACRPDGLLLTVPAVVGVLLRLLLSCDDAAERMTTLTALSRLIGAPCLAAYPNHSNRPRALTCGLTSLLTETAFH